MTIISTLNTINGFVNQLLKRQLLIHQIQYMEQNYTQENLIQFIYRENSLTEHFEIDNAIESNKDLKSKYKALKTAISALPRVQFAPSKSVIDKILKYSQSTALEAQM